MADAAPFVGYIWASAKRILNFHVYFQNVLHAFKGENFFFLQTLCSKLKCSNSAFLKRASARVAHLEPNFMRHFFYMQYKKCLVRIWLKEWSSQCPQPLKKQEIPKEIRKLNEYLYF